MITHDDVSLLFRSLLRKRWWWWGCYCRRRLAASRGSPLFRVRVLADSTLSLVLFLDIKSGIGKMQSNLSPIHIRHETRLTNTLSLFPENKRLCFLGGGVGDDDDSEESVFLFVVFGRFFFDTHIRCGRRRRPTDMMSSS